MKRKNLLALLTFLVATAALSAQTQVIAHRGYWRAPGAAQNSIVALQRADQIKCFGSECDVLQTRDGVLVVHHDAHIGPDKILIEEADYDQIKDIVLSNGETVPTLQQYLKELKKCKNTLLVLEIKEHSTDQKMLRATRDIVKMVNRMGLKKKVYYISFMPTICDELVRIAPKSQVA